MRGHIKQRSKGSYTITLELPREGTKRSREVFTVHGSRKEAERRMATRIGEIEKGEIATGLHTTVEQFLRDTWLPAVKRNKEISASTKQRYAEIVERFLIPALGHHKMTQVKALHIDAAVATWENMKNAKTKQPLSQRTIHHAFATLRTAFNYAERKDIIVRNYCAKAETVSLGKRSVTYLDRAGLLDMLKKLHGDRLEIPALVAAFCGLRRGELLALKWSDIDLERGTLKVERSLELLDVHRTAFKDPKTAESKRIVSFGRIVTQALMRHRAEQREWKMANRRTYEDQDLVFAWVEGSPWHPKRFSSEFHRRMRALKVPVTFHGLRRTFSTLHELAGTSSKTRQAMLGHTTEEMTSKYTEALLESQHKAAEQLDALFANAIV